MGSISSPMYSKKAKGELVTAHLVTHGVAGSIGVRFFLRQLHAYLTIHVEMYCSKYGQRTDRDTNQKKSTVERICALRRSYINRCGCILKCSCISISTFK